MAYLLSGRQPRSSPGSDQLSTLPLPPFVAMAHQLKKHKPNPPISPHLTRSTAHASSSSTAMAPQPAAATASGSKVKVKEVVTVDDSDDDVGMCESDDSEMEFVYDSDVVISEVDDEVGADPVEVEPMSVSEAEDDDDEGPPSPPPETIVSKGKGNSRKAYRDDIQKLVEMYGAKSGGPIWGQSRSFGVEASSWGIRPTDLLVIPSHRAAA